MNFQLILIITFFTSQITLITPGSLSDIDGILKKNSENHTIFKINLKKSKNLTKFSIKGLSKMIRFNQKNPIILNEHLEIIKIGKNFQNQKNTLLLTHLINEKDMTYYLDMKMGTKWQNMTCLPDTGSPTLVLISSLCKNCITANNYSYNPALSSTSWIDPSNSDYLLQYGSGNLTGFICQDTINIAGLIVTKQPFIAIKNYSFNVEIPFAGILGLSFPFKGIAGSIETFLQKIYDGKLLENLGLKNQFFFCLQTDPMLEYGGQFILGGRDKSLYEGPMKFVPVIPAMYWQIQMISIKVSGFPFDQPLSNEMHQAIVDSGTSLITGPKDKIEKINLVLSDRNVYYIEDQGIYLFDCNQLPKRNLILGFFNDVTLVLEPEDYILKIYDPTAPNGQFYCLSVFIEMDITTNMGPLWILGDPLMRSYVTLFDFSSRTVGFAKSKKTC